VKCVSRHCGVVVSWGKWGIVYALVWTSVERISERDGKECLFQGKGMTISYCMSVVFVLFPSHSIDSKWEVFHHG
jgi:hypothetical protein